MNTASGRPETCPVGHPAESYGRLLPACCNAFAAFPRVGAWAPALPPKAPDAAGPGVNEGQPSFAGTPRQPDSLALAGSPSP